MSCSCQLPPEAVVGGWFPESLSPGEGMAGHGHPQIRLLTYSGTALLMMGRCVGIPHPRARTTLRFTTLKGLACSKFDSASVCRHLVQPCGEEKGSERSRHGSSPSRIIYRPEPTRPPILSGRTGCENSEEKCQQSALETSGRKERRVPTGGNEAVSWERREVEVGP